MQINIAVKNYKKEFLFKELLNKFCEILDLYKKQKKRTGKQKFMKKMLYTSIQQQNNNMIDVEIK